MQYTTGIPFTGAISQDLRQQGQQGLAAPSPFSYQGPHADVYAGLAQGNVTDFQRSAQMADMDAYSRSRDMQSQMALRGLDQMAQAQDNARNVSQQIYGNQLGFLGGLLRDLYK